MPGKDKQTICDALVKAIRDASVYNPEFQTAPVCIMWPDKDRQWEAAIPLLQAELPELLALGGYTPEKRIGPAIWLRCVIAGKLMIACFRMSIRLFCICRVSAARICALWNPARIT